MTTLMLLTLALASVLYVAAQEQSQAKYVQEACARNPSLSFCKGGFSPTIGVRFYDANLTKCGD